MTSVTTTEPKTAWLTKVPLITATFWVIKVLSTTIGETFADYLSVNVGLGVAITDAAMMSFLALALIIQLRKRRYTPWIYWLCVVLVSIVGTQITDFFTDTVGVSLYVSTCAFAAVLTVVFVIWYRQERTLAISSIDTRRRELFYWAAILVTFALGTAAGDLATEALSLGFRNGVILFAGMILVVGLAAKVGLNRVLAFWIAYVLTRPLGAALGDLLTQDTSVGGLGLGASRTSLIFFGVIVVLVVREQVLVHRHGVRTKGEGSAISRHRDIAWAGAGGLLVLALGLGLSLGQAPVSQAGAPASGTGQSAARPTTALGDLTKFSTIVSDLQSRVQANDLAGAVTRVKDLEVSWDDSEAGLKPRDPQNWHVLDGQIDGVLTSIRATPPSQQAASGALQTLRSTLNKFNGV